MASTDEAPGSALVCLGVVGVDPLDVDAVAGIPADRSFPEGGAGVLVLAGQHLGVGQAGVVVDGDVQVLPASPATAIDAIPQDRLSDHVEAAQLLGIDMHQLARPGPLIADDRIALRPRQARAAPPPKSLSL